MAASPTPKPLPNKPAPTLRDAATQPASPPFPALSEPLAQAMAAFQPTLPLGVALSGGADSTALLMACVQQWPGRVVALHVNHGLQTAASAFEAQCQKLCATWHIPLRIQQVHAHAAAGQSPEDAARIARYKALLQLAQLEPALPSIALAQHADDQVETLLIALSRGAGLGGLSAMPHSWQRAGIHWYRPFLQVSGAALRAWLEKHQISHIEDPSNTDEHFTRNRIRARVLPSLRSALPQYCATFARSAAHAAQAQELLNEYAALEMQHIAPEGSPHIATLQTLSLARQANVLRYWLKTMHQTIPSSRQLGQLQHQIQACTTRAHQIHLKVGIGFVRRVGDVLGWYNP